MVLCVELGSDEVPFIQLGDYQMRLDLEELNETDKLRAAVELREIPENVEYALEKLRKLIKGTSIDR